MATFVVRNDAALVVGTVAYCWKDPWTPPPAEQEWNWHIVVQLSPGDPLLLTADGSANWLGLIECRVSPVAPFRDEPWAGQIMSELNGKRVRIFGTWGDETDGTVPVHTVVRPIGWIVTEELSVIVEEHGFTQVVRDVNLLAFSDDSAITAGNGPPAHHQAERHFAVSLRFPFKPQSEAVATHAICIDRDNIEQMLYFGRTTSRPRFPINQVRNYGAAIASAAGADVLNITLDTGTPAAGQGFLFQKIALTYDEPFEEMCLPNVCLNEPGRNCQATGEDRYAWLPSRLDSVQAGDLLLGPAGSGGIIGDLLAALTGPQFYDHMVLVVESDGQTVRHCTNADQRASNPAYYTATLKVETPLGDIEERLPLKGIRGDVLKFGWPGSITQTLSEVCITGRNHANPQFGYGTFYPNVIAAEAAAPPQLWELDPVERDKRTSYHDPEATTNALASRSAGARAYYPQVRLQRDPAWRSELDPATGEPLGWIWPIMVKPHPMLDYVVRDALRVAAEEAKKISAHYRFFAYTDSTITTDPAFNAPPESGWASGTVAAMCSSFVRTAVQAANQELLANGRPLIELEGEGEPADGRPPIKEDGIYLYTEAERIAAARALFDNVFKKVTKTVQDKVDALPGIVGAFADLTGLSSGVDAFKDALGTVVANQLCNIFAFDSPSDLTDTWLRPGEGTAVSPDDTMLRWDVKAPPEAFPPAAPPGKIHVYGTFTAINIPKGGWGSEPILKVKDSVGFGDVSGTVVRRAFQGADARRVPGATVRYGCAVTATDPEGSYSFGHIKAGVYVLRASMFIPDASSKAAVEWKSEPRLFELRDGDQVNGQELELLPPPGLARDVKILSHHDIVDRVVVGKDRWGHFDLSATINLMWDPRDNPNAPADQRNTVLQAEGPPIVTPEVGSGVHVSVAVTAALHPTGNPDEPFDGAVVVNTTLTFYDSGEGETNAIVNDLGRVLAAGDTFELPYDLVSDDTVPERASGYVRLSNVWAALS